MPKAPNPTLAPDLLSAALSHLDHHGTVDISMRQLASEVGYTVTAVYRCFENRAELLRALQLNLFEQLANEFVGLAPDGLYRDRIISMGRQFVSWAVKHPHRYRFMFQAMDAGALLHEQDQDSARAGLYLLESLVRSGHDAGEFEVADPRVVATMLFSSLHGLVSLFLANRLDDEIVPCARLFYDQHSVGWITKFLDTQPRDSQ